MLVETRLLRYLIQDVVKGDICLAVVDLQDSLILDLKEKEKIREEEFLVMKKKFVACETSLSNSADLDSANVAIALHLKQDARKYKRQRNVFRAFSVVSLAILLKVAFIP